MSLTNVPILQVLDLSNNRLSGHVPDNGSFSLFTPISFANNLNLWPCYRKTLPRISSVFTSSSVCPTTTNSKTLPRISSIFTSSVCLTTTNSRPWYKEYRGCPKIYHRLGFQTALEAFIK